MDKNRFCQMFVGRGGLVLAMLFGHFILLGASGCHLGCEICEYFNAPEAAIAADVQHARVESISLDLVLVITAALHFAGYFILAGEAMGEVVIGKHVSLTDDNQGAEAEDPYALDRWADDGGPCC